MLEKIKRHGVKIFIFAINVLLAVVAVLAIKEKDQGRLLEKAHEEKNSIEEESIKKESLPSFKGSVEIDAQGGADAAISEDNSVKAEPPVQTIPVENANITPAPSIPAATSPATTAPSPAKKTKPSNAKTKTS